MLTLGIETSGWEGSIALIRSNGGGDDAASCKEEILAVESLTKEGRRHAQSLVPQIGEVLEQKNVALSDLNLIAISIGPGSFTGLRVGVVCAKTLSYTLDCPIQGVLTFDAIAANVKMPVDENRLPLYVVADAQREELFVARYEQNQSEQNQKETGWKRKTEVSIIKAVEWSESISSPCLVTGPGLKRFGDVLCKNSNCLLADQSDWFPCADQIAILGASQYANSNANQHDSAMTLQPFYLRLSAAEEKRAAEEKQAAEEKRACENKPSG